jgi:type IV pilus assembly protein PilQ
VRSRNAALPAALLILAGAARANLPPLPADVSDAPATLPGGAELLSNPEIPSLPGLAGGTPDLGLPEASAPAPAAPLEGAPVPLAPALRLADTEIPAATAGSHDKGKGDDDTAVTLDLRDASLPAALQAIARLTGLSLVISTLIKGTVSLHLEQVPWRSAFDTVLEAHGLAAERHGTVLFVAPISEFAQRLRQRLEAHARAAELEALASRSFTLHYAQAPDLARLLAGNGAQRTLSKRGSVLADTRTNLLFVTDLPARLEQIAALIERLDQPTRQVLIEARIVEGERGFSRHLGARLLARAAGGVLTDHPAPTQEGAQSHLPALPLAGFPAASAGLSLFAASASRLLDIELSALEADGKGQIISSPRVVTADRVKALVEQGTELPYQAKVEQGVSGVQFRRATLRLEVEPQITPGGRLVLDLDIAKDSVGEETAGGPAIHTRHVRTRVEIEDGGTVSIGGIYTRDERNDVTRVPLLGKIPLLGALFRHTARRELLGELVIYITPRVVADARSTVPLLYR